LFSFGSGLASTMYLVRVNSDPSFMREKLDIENRLKSRTKVSPEEYDQIMALRQQNYGKKNYTTNVFSFFC
jgi:hydroxymethylglutaryl-CoA synthase